MARRSGKVWSATSGWVQKKETETRNYADYEDAWYAFLIWTGRWY
uniref:Uncharacterized protein n=1 Tax=Siphoviridae sp. ctoiW10 TaxID=2827592 RepID=A0A8S5LPB3_9CAUD|nr:MAG TPA: hypothetical protein [Siphoviridae sp. ctoiW10]DAE40149.1 MAG TPA: hypothetical protein [Caudoviricetes sp.]DAG75567.1 MAG TPA: hypothetical protein [Caudoviricetes sp.]DAP82924.1 MAG TPA: hypothetical protein [Caudoviricetes sp.]DAV41976.1 MAG TPA: hypothetical protein [Caudoviricetes sp.]